MKKKKKNQRADVIVLVNLLIKWTKLYPNHCGQKKEFRALENIPLFVIMLKWLVQIFTRRAKPPEPHSKWV